MLSQVKYSDLPSYHLGMQQGIQHGEVAIILRQLQRRFSDIPDDIAQRINEADIDALGELADRVLSIETLDQLFKA